MSHSKEEVVCSEGRGYEELRSVVEIIIRFTKLKLVDKTPKIKKFKVSYAYSMRVIELKGFIQSNKQQFIAEASIMKF